MNITEKAAYLRGLVEGKDLDPEAGEGKLWHVLSELVSDLAAELTALRQEHETLSDSLEEVEVGLEYLEEMIQEDYEDDEELDGEDDGFYPFGNDSFRVADDDDEDGEEDEDDFDLSDDQGDFYYEVECPNCGEEISFDDETLETGSIRCPNCGATLEFDMSGPKSDEATEQEAEPENGEDG